MLVLGLALALRPNFVAGLGLGTVALAKNSRPKSWQSGRLQNSPLTSIDWSTVTGVNYISRSTFLTYL